MDVKEEKKHVQSCCLAHKTNSLFFFPFFFVLFSFVCFVFDVDVDVVVVVVVVVDFTESLFSFIL